MATLSFTSTSANAAVVQDPHLTNGIKDYQAADYQDSVNELNQALNASPNNAYTAYWLGMSFVQEHDDLAALDALEIAEQNDNGAIAQLANNWIAYLKGPANVPASISTAQRVVQEQSDRDSQQTVAVGQTAADSINDYAGLRTDKIGAREGQVVSAMRNSYWVTRHGCIEPTYSDADIQKVADVYNNRINGVESVALNSADSAMQDSQTRADLLADHGSVVSDQLAGYNLPTGMKVSPVGTNLYVQNYQSIN